MARAKVSSKAKGRLKEVSPTTVKRPKKIMILKYLM